MNQSGAQRFDVVTVVWGQEFRQLFLDVCVPNQLTPGNLGVLPAGSRYRVFTSADDVEFLKGSPALCNANNLIPVDIVVEPESATLAEDRFKRMTACHAQALREAAEFGAGLIFLSPDLVMSEGTLAGVVRRHEGGSRAVVCTGLRVDRDAFLAALGSRGRLGALPSRELVSLALEHLHPFTRAHMVDSEQGARRPTSVYWRVPGEGILARCLYMHPLMVDPVRRDVMPDGTIDQHYLAHACPVREQIHVVADSDELVVFEMSHVDAAVTETGHGGVSLWRAARMLSRCDSHQRSYWTLPIRLHVRDTGAGWGPVEKRSARFARQVTLLRIPALWTYFTSRRLRPLRRRAGAFRKRLRAAAKLLRAQRMRRSALRAARPVQKLSERAARTGRRILERTQRSLVLLTHSAARPVQKFRKRASRAGRRVLRRVRVAQ